MLTRVDDGGVRSVHGVKVLQWMLLLALIYPVSAHAVGPSRMPEKQDAPAEATVSESSGALGYAIKIDVPPGPGGLVPSLSVNYSSHAGDGLAGIGWDVSTSMIECSRRFGVPDFSVCDRFEMDGELLVGATPWNGDTRYHTLTESFARILKKPDDTWEVTSTDGTRRIYGKVALAKVRKGANTAQWYLSEVVDLFGNTVTYTYEQPNATHGVAYLKRVSYAGGTRIVEYKYESRLDVSETYSGGLRRFVDRRLSEVIVKSGATPAVNYRLEMGYAAAGLHSTERSRLASVTRYGKDCTTTTQKPSAANCVGLPPRTFEYTDIPSSLSSQYEEVTSVSLPDGVVEGIARSLPGEYGFSYPDSYGIAWADVNGDGLEDVVRADCYVPCDPGEGVYGVYLGNGNGIDATPSAEWGTALAALRYTSPSLKLQRAGSTSFSGYQGTQTSPYCHVEIGSFESGVYFGGVNDYMVPPQPISVTPNPDPNIDGTIREFAPLGNFRMADLNGDGRADLILSSRVGGVWKKIAGADCLQQIGVDPGYENDDPEFFAGDVRVVFLNRGPPVLDQNNIVVSGGWVRAADAGEPELENVLPPFVALEFQDYLGPGHSCSPLGFFGDYDAQFYPSGTPEQWDADGYCRGFEDFDAQFVELNGDGRMDIVVLQLEDDRYLPNNSRVNIETGEARPACPTTPHAQLSLEAQGIYATTHATGYSSASAN
ncbi:MAG: SpvB/TcaC N-terminal domain-containing protein, partial [Planctomycetota bacterium]